MKNLAIIIGVSEYADENNNLPVCLNDANMIEFLFNSIEKYQDILIEKGNIDSSKVAENIIAFISKYKNEQIGEVFFYYTGHGYFDGSEFYYHLSNYDDKYKKTTSITNFEVDTWLKSLNANLTIKIIDACHSEIQYIKDPTIYDQYLNSTMNNFNDVYFMFSSQNYQKSYQNCLLSDFTKSFIDSLLQKDKILIRYRDIANYIADDFENNPKQKPRFVDQNYRTEKFADINHSIKENLENKLKELPSHPTTKRSFGNKSEEILNTQESCQNIQLPTEHQSQDLKQNNVIPDSKNNDWEWVDRYLTKRFDKALVTYPSQPKVWVEPILSKKSEVDKNADSENKIIISDLILNPKSIIIKALPQFGLTCLSHYLIREAWRKQKLWIYLDSKDLKPYVSIIKETVENELDYLKLKDHPVSCIILDSWATLDKNSHKLLKEVCSYFNDIPVIVMQTIDDSRILVHSDKNILDRKFEILYLWALPRGHVRKVVSEYNRTQYIGDEDSVITKVVSDLEVMNLHRTPLNCLTLLKVSEIDFDESPVNRTELIKRVLFLLFSANDIPTYKVRPDMKDCEYVLGFFCETMLRNRKFHFTMEEFVGALRSFCTSRVIDLDVQIVFDLLYANHILIKQGNFFCFRYSYWLYYFAAQRMHHDQNFSNFIFNNMCYANYPEIIEFYTGIDRRREDALRILIEDIRNIYSNVETKCGLPGEMNPYRLAQWIPSEEKVTQMQKEICEDVSKSNLPNTIKDQYADCQYDRTRPYHQDIENIIDDHSFVFMMQAVKSGARALRNSDYADPASKIELLREIIKCWEQISKILLILGPLLAIKGNAIYDGVGFFLTGNFGNTIKDRLQTIMTVIPINVVSWFQNDLFSPKMGPLLINQLKNEDNDLKKHKLILLLIKQRPREWKTHVQKYIATIHKNSFYLYDVYEALRSEYRYSYASPETLKDIEYLIKMSIAKHLKGIKNPGPKKIEKIYKKISDKSKVIPERETEIFS